MRLQTYRDESRARHFDLICGREHPRSILVLVITSGMLVVGFACAQRSGAATARRAILGARNELAGH